MTTETPERPLASLLLDDGRPAWQQINVLFRKNGYVIPNIALRDELVTMWSWARYGEALARRSAPSPMVSEAMVRREAVALAERAGIDIDDHDQFIDDMTRTIWSFAALSPAPAGEVGWRMVPAKLTPVMIHAYCEKANSLGFHAFMNASCAWETLLAAAPLPPSPTGGDKP